MSNKKYGILVDVAKCTGCYACYLACKDENCEEEHEGYTAAQPMTGQFWMNMVEVERGTYPKVKLSNIPIFCGHCDNPDCMNNAENGAVYKREDGIVIIDPVKAVGQKQIVNSCPHRVIYWNEDKQIPQKCDMCAHLLDQGYDRPRCVEMCPTGALIFGDVNDPKSEISRLIAEEKPSVLHPEYNLLENIYYLNVPKRFVAGSVVYKDTDQCAEEVTVVLKSDGVEQKYVTDIFGDFWFEGLDKNVNYSVEIEASGYKKVTLQTRTLNDINLGEIFLEKA